MIAQQTIDEIIERASLTEIVGETAAVKRQGSNCVALCPFHAEKTPSFSMRDDKFFHCFGCGVSGNVIGFVMRLKGLNFGEAVEELAQRLGIEVRRSGAPRAAQVKGDPQKLYAVNGEAAKFFMATLRRYESRLRPYLTQRKISVEALKTFGIGFAPPGWGELKTYLSGRGFKEDILLQSGLARRSQKGELYDAFRARLMFPIYLDAKRIAGFGGRIIPGLADEETINSAPKYINSSDSAVYEKHKVLFGVPQALSAIRQSGEVCLVEGYMDVIGLWQVGVKNVLATCGTALTEKHVRRLRHLAKKVIVLFDGDKAGRTAAGRAFEVFLNSGLDAAALFLEAEEDPDTFAGRHGPQTAGKLAEMPRLPLLDCFIEMLLSKFGAKEAAALGAAAKGRVCEELAQILGRVTNSIERSELTQKAAMRLKVAGENLAGLIEGQGQSESGEERALDGISRGGVPEVKELPPLDRMLLQAVMVKRKKLIAEVLRDAELCPALQAVTLAFIEGLSEIIERDGMAAEAQKESIHALLKSYGPSWVRLWKEAYAMRKDPECDFEQSLEQCRRSVRRAKLNQAIDDIKRTLQNSSSEDEKIDLIQRQYGLERQMRDLG